MKAVLLGAVLSATVLQANAGLVTIDFNAFSANTLITNQYAAQGVTFGNASISQYTCCGTPGPVLVNSLDGGNSRSVTLDIFFTAPVDNISFDYNNYGGYFTSNNFRLYGANNNLLEVGTPTSASASTLTNYTFSAADVSRLTIEQPTQGWLFAIDNLSFTPNGSTVPEPSTLALGALALAALRLTTRRAA